MPPARYREQMAAKDVRVVEVSGRTVEISSPDKVYFPELGATKFDLVSYYLEIADAAREHRRRPARAAREVPRRAPGGKSFFQKRVPANAPSWLQTTVVTTPNGTTSNALVVADVAHVLWAVNLGCLGLHLWPYRADDPDHADELRIDLDPQPGTSFDEIRTAAGHVRSLLRRARHRRLSQDDGKPGPPRLRPARTSLGQLRGACRRGGAGPGARAPVPRPDHGQLVEGGARRAHLRRLQSECAPQDGLRSLVRPAAGRWSGVDPVGLGRGRHGRPGGAHHPDRPRARPAARRPLGGDRRPAPVAPTPVGHGGQGPVRRAARRAVAARVSQAARRAASGGARAGPRRDRPGGPDRRPASHRLPARARRRRVLQGPGLPQCRRGHRRPARRRADGDDPGPAAEDPRCRQDERPGDRRGGRRRDARLPRKARIGRPHRP